MSTKTTTAGVTPAPRPIPIRAFFARLLTEYDFLDRKTSTKSLLRRTFAALYTLSVETTAALAASDLEDRFVELRKPERAKTRAKALRGLRFVRNRAFDLGLVGSLPAFGPLPEDEGPPVPRRNLSRKEVEAVLARLKVEAETLWEARRLYIAARLAAGAGLRIRKELLPLEWADVDLEAGTILVRTRAGSAKKARRSVVDLPAELVAELKSWKSAADSETWVLPNATGCNHWSASGRTADQPASRLAAAGRAADVEGVTFDALRQFYEVPRPPGLELGGAPLPAPSISGAEAPVPAASTPARYRHRRPPAAVLTTNDATVFLVYLIAHSDSWDGHRDLVAFGIALFTGIPLRTLLGLDVADYDRATRTLRIRGEAAPHEIGPEAAALVEGWLDRPGRPDWPWIFPGPLQVGPWSGPAAGGQAYRRLLEVAGAAGLGHVTSVSLREFHDRCGGHVAAMLGEAYHAAEPPARFAGGPSPRPPGRPPKGERARTYVHWTQRLEAARAKAKPNQMPTAAERGAFEKLVELGDSHLVPPVVLGVPKPQLTPEAFRVIRALKEAGRDGLDYPDLKTASEYRGDIRRILRRLKKDPHWKTILRTPGQGVQDGLYRLAPPGTHDKM